MTLLLSLFGLVLIAAVVTASCQEYRDFRDERSRSVRVNEGGWHEKSWEFAKARTRFVVEGFSKQDEAFGEELSSAFNFRLKIRKSKAVFIPQD